MIDTDTLRESLSYPELFGKLLFAVKTIRPEHIRFGRHEDQYFLYYKPEKVISDKIVVWVHGGGWDSGTPEMFDFAGQCIAGAGYRFISIGYRHSPVYKYPCQIKDVCRGFNAAVKYLKEKNTDTSKLVVSGSSAGAQLSSILCYSSTVQEKQGVDVSGVIGFIGIGGPYSFSEKQPAVGILLDRLFKNGYDRRNGEPLALMKKRNIPMLLIQSRHDGIVNFSCAEKFSDKAERLGIKCELYEVTDRKDTHSWYTAGMFLESREENKGLDKLFSWTENL